jgi:hypothetical protein
MAIRDAAALAAVSIVISLQWAPRINQSFKIGLIERKETGSPPLLAPASLLAPPNQYPRQALASHYPTISTHYPRLPFSLPLELMVSRLSRQRRVCRSDPHTIRLSTWAQSPTQSSRIPLLQNPIATPIRGITDI